MNTGPNPDGSASTPLARHPTPRRFWGLRPRLVVDIILAVSFLVLMSVNLTGLPIHEWLGIALMLVVIVHLLSQWDWTISSSRGFLSHLTQRVRLTYVLNWALFISVVLVFFSGLVISENALPSLGLSIGQRGTGMFGFWHQLHTLTADAVLVLAAIHLGLNWRWVVSTLQQVLHIAGRRRGTQTGSRSGAHA